MSQESKWEATGAEGASVSLGLTSLGSTLQVSHIARTLGSQKMKKKILLMYYPEIVRCCSGEKLQGIGTK